MDGNVTFDVLVVGSGASGLAAALSASRADARVGLVAKGSLQSCNSAKAQGGIQAAVGDDDSPALHADDVWRSSHETADRALVDVLTTEAPGAIAWLEENGVEFTRENGSGPSRYRIARCGGASRKRLLQVGDRTGHAITKALRERVVAAGVTTLEHHPLAALRSRGERLGGDVPSEGRSRPSRSRPAPSCSRPAAGAFARPSFAASCRRTIPERRARSTQIALELGAASRDLDALQYHPNGGAWPPNMEGYSIPETTRAYGAVLLNADGEEFTDSLGPRDTVAAAIVAGGRGRPRDRDAGGPPGRLGSTRRSIPEADADVSLPYMLRRYRAAGIDPLTEPIMTYPVLHYQNGGLVIDENGETTLEGLFACGEIAGGTHGTKPDDGQLAARMLRLRPPRGTRCGGESEGVRWR